LNPDGGLNSGTVAPFVVICASRLLSGCLLPSAAPAATDEPIIT
jgi:hypothetical protein